MKKIRKFNEAITANCFRYYKIRSKENDEQKLGEINEGIEVLNEAISNL